MKNVNNKEQPNDNGRRKFLNNGLLAMGALAVSAVPAVTVAHDLFYQRQSLTVQDVINLILKEIKLAPIPDTIDTIKFGDTGQVVTGIVSTMFPTVAVIEEAIRRNANLLIVHEPTFFSGLDRTEQLEPNAVMEKKKALLQKNQIVIWRFHDYSHAVNPDMIIQGVLKKMNWLSYYKEDDPLVNIPAVSLDQLVLQFKSNLAISHVRVMGNRSTSCSSIALLPGAWGVQKHIETVEKSKPDVLVVGELVEWETAEYFRDAIAMGAPTALVVLGHSVSEEPGMEYFATWLTTKLPGVNTTHIPSGDPFTWM